MHLPPGRCEWLYQGRVARQGLVPRDTTLALLSLKGPSSWPRPFCPLSVPSPPCWWQAACGHTLQMVLPLSSPPSLQARLRPRNYELHSNRQKRFQGSLGDEMPPGKATTSTSLVVWQASRLVSERKGAGKLELEQSRRHFLFLPPPSTPMSLPTWGRNILEINSSSLCHHCS